MDLFRRIVVDGVEPPIRPYRYIDEDLVMSELSYREHRQPLNREARCIEEGEVHLKLFRGKLDDGINLLRSLLRTSIEAIYLVLPSLWDLSHCQRICNFLALESFLP